MRHVQIKQGFPGRTYKPYFPIAQIASSRNTLFLLLLLHFILLMNLLIKYRFYRPIRECDLQFCIFAI